MYLLYLEEADAARLLAALHDVPPQYSAMVQLGLFTGMRRGEICGLRWSDIDFNASTISVNRTVEYIPHEGLIFTAPKTKAQQRYSRLTGDTNRPNGRVERVQRTAKMECNLLGLTVDEALSEVDSFIDRAILNGQTVVYLIHGNGTGALRTAIHKHLRGNRMVKSFRLGHYGEGESGVTVVELK